MLISEELQVDFHLIGNNSRDKILDQWGIDIYVISNNKVSKPKLEHFTIKHVGGWGWSVLSILSVGKYDMQEKFSHENCKIVSFVITVVYVDNLYFTWWNIKSSNIIL